MAALSFLHILNYILSLSLGLISFFVVLGGGIVLVGIMFNILFIFDKSYISI